MNSSRIPKNSLHFTTFQAFQACVVLGFFSLAPRHLPSLLRQGFRSCQAQTTRGAGDDHRLLGLQKGHGLGGFKKGSTKDELWPRLNGTDEWLFGNEINSWFWMDLDENMSFFGGWNVLRVGIRSLSLFGLVEFWSIKRMMDETNFLDLFLADPGKLELN